MKEKDAIQRANNVRRGITYRYAKDVDANEDAAIMRGIEYAVSQRNAALQAEDEIEARRWKKALGLVTKSKTTLLRKEIRQDGADFKSLFTRDDMLSGHALENLADSIPQDD